MFFGRICAFCWSLSIPACSTFVVSTLPNVLDALASGVLVCIIRFVQCRASHFCFMHVGVGSLCFVRCFVRTAFGSEFGIKNAVGEDCARYVIAVYGYGARAYFQHAVRS